MNDESKAKAVWDAVKALNTALRAAYEGGIKVEIEVDDRTEMQDTVPRLQVAVEVYRKMEPPK